MNWITEVIRQICCFVPTSEGGDLWSDHTCSSAETCWILYDESECGEGATLLTLIPVPPKQSNITVNKAY